MNDTEFNFFESVTDSALKHKALAEYEKKHTFPFGITFLDDAFGGLTPNDLFLIGAGTGAGKSELAVALAANAASQGRRVKFFALEAEKHEVAMRLLYRQFNKWLYTQKFYDRQILDKLSFENFMKGEPETAINRFRSDVPTPLEELRTLEVKYSIHSFTIKDLHQKLIECENNADLIILDHLHYFDLEGENENKEMKDIIKKLRSFVLDKQVPVIMVAHIRKQNEMIVKLTPNGDDFHGSSDILKISTKAITMGVPSATDCLYISGYDEFDNMKPQYEDMDIRYRPTFIRAVKNRRNGNVTMFTALCQFDPDTRSYATEYYLGKQITSGRNAAFLNLNSDQKPKWAKHAICLGKPKPQKQV